MKKIAFTLIFIFLAMFSFSQEWERDYEFEDLLWTEWDVEVEVWTIYEDGMWRINFEDFLSTDWDNVYYNLAFTLAAFEEILFNNDLNFDETDVGMFIFSWFEEYNPDNPYNEETNIRWDIFMERDWLDRYFNSRFNKQFEMIDMVIGPVYDEWLDSQEVQNYFNRKR